MDLYHFHRVLIASAILFFLGFAVYAYRQSGDLGSGLYLAMAVGSGVISLSLIAYLVYFNMSIRKLTAGQGSH
jgi:hypothetical protein